MRFELQKYNNKLITITAVVGLESSRGHLELKDIRTINSEYLCDHLWVEITNNIRLINYRKGDVIQFDARVRTYYKGGHSCKGYYKEKEFDYGLYRIRACVNLTRTEGKLVA